MIPSIQYFRKSKTMKTVKRSVVARGQGEAGMNRLGTEDFYNSESMLHDTALMVYMLLYLHPTVLCTSAHRMYNTKSEL